MQLITDGIMMKNSLTHFAETVFYSPNIITKAVSYILLPLSVLYASVMSVRRAVSKRESFDKPIVSVGNLVVGGSGKTPFIISLAKRIDVSPIYIVSRGYGRESRGLVEVSHPQKGILCEVEDSGDEPMLIAQSLPGCGVIVSEERKEGIAKAIEKGAKAILLDDGFNRVDIDKFEIVLEPENLPNIFPLPSGPFREFRVNYRYADIVLKEGRGYNRIVKCIDCRESMVLATAIASPQRLDKYLPDGVTAKIYRADHERFEEGELQDLLKRYNADSILMTEKDMVKNADMKLPISILSLDMEIDDKTVDLVNRYIKDFYEKEA